jgi:hypothetical protein
LVIGIVTGITGGTSVNGDFDSMVLEEKALSEPAGVGDRCSANCEALEVDCCSIWLETFEELEPKLSVEASREGFFFLLACFSQNRGWELEHVAC